MSEIDLREVPVACEEPGCGEQLALVVGVGRRRCGRQRLSHVCLVCAAHAGQIVRRRLFDLEVRHWLRSDLRPFQRRWHRPDELTAYLGVTAQRRLPA
jgi:hypothetical protein